MRGSVASARATSRRRRSLRSARRRVRWRAAQRPTSSSTPCACAAHRPSPRGCKNAPTIAFSSTVSVVSVCDIWKVRPKPDYRALLRRKSADVSPLKKHAPRRRSELPGEEIEQRRLAGAVRADDADELALRDVEGHVVDREQPAEALGDTASIGQKRRAHRFALPGAPGRSGLARRRRCLAA